MTDERLAELERLCAAATPGPWKDAGCFVHRRQHGGEEDGWWGNAFTTGPLRSLMADDAPPDDARFIAAARTAVPELIAEVRRLRSERPELPELLTDLQVSGWLAVPSVKVRRWAKRGLIPAMSLPDGSYLFDPKVLTEWAKDLPRSGPKLNQVS